MSEASGYALLKALDLIANPAYIVMKAAGLGDPTMQCRMEFEVERVDLNWFEMSDFEGKDFVLLEVLRDGLMAYEKPLPSVLVAYLAENPGVFFDVGANTGLYTLLAAAVSPAIEVVAFEPLPDIFAKLNHNVALNPRLMPRVRCIDRALSAQTGTADFYETLNDMGFISTSSSLEEAHALATNPTFRKLSVETVTLDDWIEGNPVAPAISAIKIDVEGHEAAVLAGAAGFLARHRPLAIVELLAPSDFAFVGRFVAAHRYVNFELEPQRIRIAPELRFSQVSWNHILCPEEKVYQFVRAIRRAGLEFK